MELLAELALLIVGAYFLLKDYKDLKHQGKGEKFFRGVMLFIIILLLMSIVLR